MRDDHEGFNPDSRANPNPADLGIGAQKPDLPLAALERGTWIELLPAPAAGENRNYLLWRLTEAW